jgi:hypothetical protein
MSPASNVAAAITIAPSTPVASTSIASTPAPTRGEYERSAFQLLRLGRVPGLTLDHLSFRVLLFLLGQRPGTYAAHQQTIARALDSNVSSIRVALRRLRAAGLVLWELIPPHHVLPTGRFARTNVCRYLVDLTRLAGALGLFAGDLVGPRYAPPRSVRRAVSAVPSGATRPTGLGAADGARDTLDEPDMTDDSHLDETVVHAPDSDASTRSNSDASTCTDLRSEQKASPLPLAPVVCDSPAETPREEEAISQNSQKPQNTPQILHAQIAHVAQLWDRLGFDSSPIGARERRALENRHREGATFEQLEAAVAGAGVDDWLRRRAKAPFAVVFASVASVERFAHEGRKLAPSPRELAPAPCTELFAAVEDRDVRGALDARESAHGFRRAVEGDPEAVGAQVHSPHPARARLRERRQDSNAVAHAASHPPSDESLAQEIHAALVAADDDHLDDGDVALDETDPHPRREPEHFGRLGMLGRRGGDRDDLAAHDAGPRTSIDTSDAGSDHRAEDSTRQPAAPLPAAPLTPEEFERRRAEQLARARAWMQDETPA